jgi:hypothetical protein
MHRRLRTALASLTLAGSMLTGALPGLRRFEAAFQDADVEIWSSRF